MNIILGLGIGVIGVLVLMGHITLEKKLNSLDKKMDKQKDYWKSVESSIEIQSNQITKKIQLDKESLENTLNQTKEDINKNTHKEVTRIIYTAPMVKIVD